MIPNLKRRVIQTVKNCFHIGPLPQLCINLWVGLRKPRYRWPNYSMQMSDVPLFSGFQGKISAAEDFGLVPEIPSASVCRRFPRPSGLAPRSKVR